MHHAQHPSTHRLLPGQPLRLRRRQPLRLRAQQGSLWITVDGLPDDFVLQPGECHVFAAGARLLVTAIDGGAELTATALPAAPAWRARLTALVARLGHLGRHGSAVGA